MRAVTSEKEERRAPKNRESISCQGLYFVKKCLSVIKTTVRPVAALVRFVNSGDGGFVKEWRTFVSGGMNLWFMDRIFNRRSLWP